LKHSNYAYSRIVFFLQGDNRSTGYTHSLNVSKTGGRFNMSFGEELADNKYSSNDMGYFTNNNFVDHFLWMGYKQVKPKGLFNSLYMNFNGYFSMRFKPWDYQMARTNVNVNGQLKNLWYVGVFNNILPQQSDFYEPRVSGKVFKRPSAFVYGGWFNSNSAKKYSASLEVDITRSNQYNSNGYDIFINHKYRFNKKLTLSTNTNLSIYTNNLGYAATSADSVIFGLRKRNTVENIFTIKYNFNNKMGLSFRARHYWSKVDNRQYFSLQNDGSVSPISSRHDEANYNVNYFNIDMVYTWQFALGSFINIVWKNSIGTFDQDVNDGYFKNAGNTFNAPQLNSLSVRVIYFLDYLSLKKK